MNRKFVETGDNLPAPADNAVDPKLREGQDPDRENGPEDREGDLDEKGRRERREEQRMGNPVKTQ